MPCARNSRPCRPLDLFRFRLKHIDEQLANRLALLLGIGDPGELAEEKRFRLNVNQRDVVAVAEQRHDLLRLAEPQQAVVDEHAGELLADRFVDQHRRHRGVDAAGQPADHPALADLLADLLDRLVAERAHRPVAVAADDLADEIAQQRRAMRRVHDLEMELRRVELARLVGDHRDRRIRRGRDRAEAGRQLGHPVAVAHPDRIFLALLPDALEQLGVFGDLDLGAAELAVMPALDLAAELLRHRLLAVADAEHRHAGVINRLWCKRRILVEHRGGPAGEDHAARLHRRERRRRVLERHDLGIDPLLADTPRDQLGHLGAEIDNENFVVGARTFACFAQVRRPWRSESAPGPYGAVM